METNQLSIERLFNFLMDDVSDLLTAIRENEDIALTFPGGHFDTLEDFANYWERVLPKLQDYAYQRIIEQNNH